MTVYEPRLARCVECKKSVDINDRYAWTQVLGFERPREQGGTNHVALRRPTGKWMCNGCMTKLRNGLDPGQGSLL